MRIAYLVNQYPKVSHSFIRREILALEGLGVEVDRYSIRAVPVAELADRHDIAEHARTTALLAAGPKGLLLAVAKTLLTAFPGFVAAMGRAVALGRRSRRGMLRHCVYVAEACLLKERLGRDEVEHLHAHFGTNSTAVAMLCHLLGGPEYSFTCHGPEEFDDPVGLSLAEKISRCRFVVAVSDFGRSQLLRHCPWEQWERIKVVHCTVDDAFVEVPAHPIPLAPRLVCVGRLCAQKGQLLLLEAVKVLAERGIACELVLAGDGEMRGEVEALIDQYGLRRQVTISGWISGEQVRQQLLASRAMVLPSFAEGLPVVIMEALALGRPVVSTFVAGIPELVVDGDNGWLVPAGSLTELVAALTKVLAATPEELQRMGKAGVARVAARHNPLIEAKKLISYFEA